MNAKYRNSLAGMAALAIVFTSGIALSPKIMPTHEKIKTPQAWLQAPPRHAETQACLPISLVKHLRKLQRK